jgi:SpoVK/Ycf46/Vps4 family AAA+-type ATPase
MCLSGPPGTGKTLLSESISEFLHKPLYSISSGELGTTVDTLEKKLNEILELAYAWNAIILIDEADIFMEERSTNDIQRNAMVSVFLRLLERYQGIMFLTTNRPDNFDPAFKSRISISIKYKDLDKETRFKIWNNLLDASNIFMESEAIHELSETQMNGRQIKNAIRMSQCLANDSGSNVTKEVVKEVLPFII